MELAICFLGNRNFYGLDNIHVVYLSLNYYDISTPQKINRIKGVINRINRGIQSILSPNLKNKQKAQIEIIKKIDIEDDDGDIYTCAICYTHLLRIIQRRWRKKIELRKKIYNHPLFINYLKKREVTNNYRYTIRDIGIVGLFYGNLVVNI